VPIGLFGIGFLLAGLTPGDWGIGVRLLAVVGAMLGCAFAISQIWLRMS
jgi:hypothetical protein